MINPFGKFKKLASTFLFPCGSAFRRFHFRNLPKPTVNHRLGTAAYQLGIAFGIGFLCLRFLGFTGQIHFLRQFY
jgi:hypothetical protein